MMEIIKQHPGVSLGLGVTGLALLGYVLKDFSNTKNSNGKKKPVSEVKDYTNQQKKIHQALLKLQKTRELYKQKSKNFNLNYIEQLQQKILTEDCILRLLQTCNELFDKDQLQSIYQTSRQARRNIFNFILPNANIISASRPSFHSPDGQIMEMNVQIDQVSIIIRQTQAITQPESLHYSELYFRFVCAFEEEIKYFIEKTQKDFVVFLNIPFSYVTQSIDYHLAKQDNQNFKNSIQEWTSSVRQILKTYLIKYHQTIGLSEIKQILQYQIEELGNKQSRLIEMIRKLGITNDQELQCVPTFLAVYLQDLVNKKYSVQQEQMTIDIMHISTNEEMKKLVEQFQSLSEQLMKEMYEQVKRQTILDHSDYF